MNTDITDEHIKMFMHYPHTFGQYLGYELLSDIHTKWIRECWMRDTDFALRAHRNSYKTTAILVVGAIWWLTFFNANERILFERKSWEEAAAIVMEIRQQFESTALQILYQKKLKIDNIRGGTWKDSALTLSTKTQITKEPSISCGGISKNVTGAHYTKIFADDIITLKDRVSEAERKSTKRNIRELTNIKTIDGNIVYTGTPWHKEDGWNYTPTPVDYPIGSIEITGFTDDKLAEYKNELGASLYAANYELKHIADEDRLFPEPQYREWPERVRKCCAYIDPAYGGGDATALSVISLDINNAPIIRGWIWWESVVDVYAEIISHCRHIGVGTIYIETNADKGASKKDLDKLWPAVIGKNESMNKHVRIVSFVKYNWFNIFFSPDCNPEYLNQILDYTELADNDDAPDSLAGLIRETGIGGNSLLDRFGIQG